MTRRAAAGLGRLQPLLPIAAAVVVVAGAALLAACGGSSGGSSTAQPTATVTVTAPGSATASPASPSPSASPAQTALRVYFLRDEKLGVAERRVAHTTMPATAAMKGLLAGPTSAESAAGLTSAIPAGTRLLGLTLDGSTARVDLSSRFASGGGSLSMTARVAEVVYTVTRYPDRALRPVPGGRKPHRCARRRGHRARRSPDPRRLARLRARHLRRVAGRRRAGPEPVRAHRHGERVRRRRSRRASSTRPAGASSTSSCRRAAALPAAAVSPRRSPSPPRRRAARCIVFDQSMENGSRQDEVKIPVTFAAD